MRAVLSAGLLAALLVTSPAAFAKEKPVDLCKDKGIIATMNKALRDGRLGDLPRSAMSYGVLFNRIVRSTFTSQEGKVTYCRLTIELTYGGQGFNKRGGVGIEPDGKNGYYFNFSAFE